MGRHAGWTEKLAGFQRTFLTSLQALPDQLIGQYFQHPVRHPQADPVPTNTDAADIPRYIQVHAAQVDQWRQMVNA